jgi:hypothetical protein
MYQMRHLQGSLSGWCSKDKITMIKLKIDDREVSAGEGMTILEAATREGIDIPSMCHNRESGHFTSCMVCLVRERNSPSLFPSCAVMVTEGMDIITIDPEIAESRKTALELLLSEHIGDCEAPCRISCPANMDIPLMNTFLAAGMYDEALQTVVQDIALPSVLGRICPAPCEGACHRKGIDAPVSICILKRFAGDRGTRTFSPAPPRSGNVAIIGAGIAGLSAVWYLQLAGISCELFDSNPMPGGALRYEIDASRLDRKVLDDEINHILSSGVRYHPGKTVDTNLFIELVATRDAVVVATGNFSGLTGDWGLDNNGKQLTVNKRSLRTNIPNVFAIGNVNRSTKLAIRSAAQGKEVSFSILQMLDGLEPEGEPKQFNSRIGRLRQEEHGLYMQETSRETRLEPVDGNNSGFNPDEVAREASRCMHCECLKPANCTLRILAGKHGASQRRFSYEERKTIKKNSEHDQVVYEAGKCIKCGICVRLAAVKGESPGLTFMGRGYDVEIAVPFEESIRDAIKKSGLMLTEACPTGALSARPTGAFPDQLATPEKNK